MGQSESGSNKYELSINLNKHGPLFGVVANIEKIIIAVIT